MRLHVFNPEHDLSLAANILRFTPPKAARVLRESLDFLPALWAGEGDFVLVFDKEKALDNLYKLRLYNIGAQFVTDNSLKQYFAPEKIHVFPWGWDLSVVERLQRIGAEKFLLPTASQLDDIRQISHRAWSANHLLSKLRGYENILTAEAWEACSENALDEICHSVGRCVLKAPWSCSGRGIRYVQNERDFLRNRQWALQVIRKQGSLCIEPLYNNVCDFAMEFTALSDGTVRYNGLSVFSTTHGAYQGNMVAPEAQKQSLLAQDVPEPLIGQLAERLRSTLQEELQGRYEGPMGIDLMVVRMEEQGILVHPCVELNLRRTMGHVAIDLVGRMPIGKQFFAIRKCEEKKLIDERDVTEGMELYFF